ncbi:MAG: PHP domain-containing protein [Spirochaetaceae bacterium]|jgi:predicted metal-dependent phosphoesterase TrpH|nr:PHP domain-containing protein [Spirochaetaceae bacterium]
MTDLHTHSTASDGNLTPSELVRAANSLGMDSIALTDHDTIDGISEAQKEAEKLNINLIPGIELDINWQYKADGTPAHQNCSREFHLLGLGLKTPSPAFLEMLTEIKGERTRRNLLIIEKMRCAGIDADYEELRGITSGNCIGRPHFAQYLIKLGKTRSIQAAFDRFLGKGKPFYIQKTGVDFKRAVCAIHESGALAVLAHPATLYVSWGRLPDILEELKEQGLDGIEAWHPAATERACQRLAAIGKKLDLLITAGSDFHGEKRPGRRLGYTGGGHKIENSFLDKFPYF